MTTFMGGKVDILNEVKAGEYFGEFCGCCDVSGVVVDGKIAKEED